MAFVRKVRIEIMRRLLCLPLIIGFFLGAMSNLTFTSIIQMPSPPATTKTTITTELSKADSCTINLTAENVPDFYEEYYKFYESHGFW